MKIAFSLTVLILGHSHVWRLGEFVSVANGRHRSVDVNFEVESVRVSVCDTGGLATVGMVQQRSTDNLETTRPEVLVIIIGDN